MASNEEPRTLTYFHLSDMLDEERKAHAKLRGAAEAAVEYMELTHEPEEEGTVLHGLRVALGMDGETDGGEG